MDTVTLPDVLLPELTEFARTLKANGFEVYVFKSDARRVGNGGKPACARTLGFSRTVDGKVCWASVSFDNFGFVQFSMPIRPSRQAGSSMFIGGDSMPRDDELTLDLAELYASPTGHNRLVGTQANDGSTFAHLYVSLPDPDEEPEEEEPGPRCPACHDDGTVADDDAPHGERTCPSCGGASASLL